MKFKIVIICYLFLLCGCSSREVNELSIVTGIGIDYTNGQYEISLLSVDTNKSSDSIESIVIKSGGTSLKEAFSSLNRIDPKEKFFGHVMILLVSENAGRNKMEDIIDYINEKQNIHHNFYVFVSTNSTYELLETLSSNTLEKNYFKDLKGILYSDFLTRTIKDDSAKLRYLIIDGDEVKVGTSANFKNYKLID